MGCQDLAEEVPGRTRKEHPASPDLRSFVKGVKGLSSSKSYSVKDETSSKFQYFANNVKNYVILNHIIIVFTDDIMAVIKLDNQTVGQTSWRPCSQQAWDQRCKLYI